MENAIIVNPAQSKNELYESVIPQIESLMRGETDATANLSNVAAALKMTFPYYSWVGFYFWKKGELVLGPFQGKPACVRIQAGRGVCGTSFQSKKTLVVPDVDKFPGHIACDPDSRSEIVIPLLRNGGAIGVLDVDSAAPGSFDEDDRQYLEQLASIIVLQSGI